MDKKLELQLTSIVLLCAVFVLAIQGSDHIVRAIFGHEGLFAVVSVFDGLGMFGLCYWLLRARVNLGVSSERPQGLYLESDDV